MKANDKEFFYRLFISGGYVLDFSTEKFNDFTKECINVPLCDKYGLSKGKSLIAFCNEYPDEDVIKLFSNLLDYYENHCRDNNSYTDNNKEKCFKECKKIIQKYSNLNIINIPIIKKVNTSYIYDIINRAKQDISNDNYDSAITKSRTLLEEVFCYAIEKRGEQPSKTGKIDDLYNKVKELYNVCSSNETDKRINMLISGLNKILSAISEMRNGNSDSHGVGSRRKNIKRHHAILFLNSAITMAEFIMSVVDYSNRTK